MFIIRIKHIPKYLRISINGNLNRHQYGTPQKRLRHFTQPRCDLNIKHSERYLFVDKNYMNSVRPELQKQRKKLGRYRILPNYILFSLSLWAYKKWSHAKMVIALPSPAPTPQMTDHVYPGLFLRGHASIISGLTMKMDTIIDILLICVQ